MNAKRIILLLVALLFVWYAFFRKKNLPAPAATVVGTPNGNPLQNLVNQTEQNAATGALSALSGLTGAISNGVVTSTNTTSNGGSSGNSTQSTMDPGSFDNTDPIDVDSGIASGTGGEF